MNTTETDLPKKNRNIGKNVVFTQTHLDPPSALANLKGIALESMFKGITRDKREKLLSGIQNQKNPPVG